MRLDDLLAGRAIAMAQDSVDEAQAVAGLTRLIEFNRVQGTASAMWPFLGQAWIGRTGRHSTS